MIETTGLEPALRAARQMGAEACANRRSIYPNGDDRADIAFYYGVEKWQQIPDEESKQLVAVFQEGWKAEKATQRCGDFGENN